MKNEQMIELNTRHITTALWIGGLFLLVMHVLAMVLKYRFGREYFYGFIPLFDFAFEQSVPTYFSCLLMVLSGGLFFILWKLSGPTYRGRHVWLVLSIIFCLLSLDEFAAIHERMIDPMRAATDATGVFFFAWIIPYGIGVLVLGVFVLPLIWRLGPYFFSLFALAATCYVGGAIGVEMIEGVYYEAVGTADLTYRIISSFQETLEILGLLILSQTLFMLVCRKYGGLTIRLNGGHKAENRE